MRPARLCRERPVRRIHLRQAVGARAGGEELERPLVLDRSRRCVGGIEHALPLRRAERGKWPLHSSSGRLAEPRQLSSPDASTSRPSGSGFIGPRTAVRLAMSELPRAVGRSKGLCTCVDSMHRLLCGPKGSWAHSRERLPLNPTGSPGRRVGTRPPAERDDRDAYDAPLSREALPVRRDPDGALRLGESRNSRRKRRR